jgi:hypothetical protein
VNSALANDLKGQLGDGTGIRVQSAKKYLTRSGLELVPGTGFEPSVQVYYRGLPVGLVYRTCGTWTLAGRPFRSLAAAALMAGVRHLETVA